ncbi:MAG: hypothetical protein QW244_00340 [Candidatus Pacearchaeota archaeon]
MKITALFALIDVYALLMLFALIVGIKPHLAIAIAVFLLLIKVLLFFTGLCLASAIDVFVALVLILENFFDLGLTLLFIATLLLGQKAFFSFL